MGFKAVKAAIVILTLLLLPNTVVRAATVSDLYTMYNKELTSMYPDKVLETIADYQRAQRLDAMYRYVQKSEFDDTITKAKIKGLRSEKSALAGKLEGGYNLPLSDIYELEEEYVNVDTQLSNSVKASDVEEVTLDKPVAPTEEEYQQALKDKEAIDNSVDIGTIPIKYPVSGFYNVLEKTDTHLRLQVESGEKVSPILNGVVNRIDDKSITVSHGNGVYTYYGGIETPVVKVGESVYQGQSLGYTSNAVVFKVKINEDIVDVSKLFLEGQ